MTFADPRSIEPASSTSTASPVTSMPSLNRRFRKALANHSVGLPADTIIVVGAAPAGIDPAAVQNYLTGLPGVTSVHDLHIWGMSTTHAALTAHLVRPGAAVDDALMNRVCSELHELFGIDHATIQVESGEGVGCAFEPEDVV